MEMMRIKECLFLIIYSVNFFFQYDKFSLCGFLIIGINTG